MKDRVHQVPLTLVFWSASNPDVPDVRRYMIRQKYLEKKLPISVKYRRNGDFTRHIAKFESGLDRAPVFGPIKLFDSSIFISQINY